MVWPRALLGGPLFGFVIGGVGLAQYLGPVPESSAAFTAIGGGRSWATQPARLTKA